MAINIHSVYRPFLRHFRCSRLKLLYSQLEISASTRVLDLGGNYFFWQLAEELRLPVPQVTVVNLTQPWTDLPPYMSWVIGNGTHLPFADNSFDIVFCNSVIEHLATWEAQEQIANEIRRVGPHYFVQTPNRSFFVEPHLLTPFVHWLPSSARKRLVRNWTVWGLLTRPSPAKCEELINELRLLNADEMRKLFPNAQILMERFLGLPKSIVAVRA